jgi:hypothetical protein
MSPGGSKNIYQNSKPHPLIWQKGMLKKNIQSAKGNIDE